MKLNFRGAVSTEYNKNKIRYLELTRGGGVGEGGLPCPFSKIGKKCPNLWKKCPDCGHLWVNFSFKTHFLRVSRQKNKRFFPCGAFLSCLVGECLLKCHPHSKKIPMT